jgi:hypothetical protein
LTVTGDNFISGATVTLGGAAATSVLVESGTKITATTPPHKQGGVDIVVTNPDKQSSTLSSGFVYHKN